MSPHVPPATHAHLPRVVLAFGEESDPRERSQVQAVAISWRCTPIGYRCKGAAAIIHRHQGALPDRTVPDCQPMMSLSAGVKAQQGCCARRSTPMWHQHQTWRGNTHRGGAVEFPAQRPSGHSSLSDHRRAAAALPDLRLSFDESGVHANFEIEQARNTLSLSLVTRKALRDVHVPCSRSLGCALESPRLG